MKIDEIKQKVVPILKEAGVTRSSLFGSVVRGEDSAKSDIDILVDVPAHTGLFQFISLEQKLEEMLGRRVDLVTFSGLKQRIRDRVLREQVSILRV